MLKDQAIDYVYREYRRDPLSEEELREVFAALGCSPADLLRRRDKAFRELGLSGDEPDDELLKHMAEHPTLLQRPIGVFEGRAVVGRPVERLLELF